MPKKVPARVRIGPLKKGSLMGYHTKDPKNTRHQSLTVVILSKEKPLGVFRKLGALMVLSKHRTPKSSKVFRENRNWVKKTFMQALTKK
jgi:hypothetical protein